MVQSLFPRVWEPKTQGGRFKKSGEGGERTSWEQDFHTVDDGDVERAARRSERGGYNGKFNTLGQVLGWERFWRIWVQHKQRCFDWIGISISSTSRTEGLFPCYITLWIKSNTFTALLSQVYFSFDREVSPINNHKNKYLHSIKGNIK